jgi:hypothetical protein
VKTAATIIRLLLNVAGASLAGWALIQDYRKHARQPLLPWVAVKEWFLANVLRQTRSVTVHGGAAHATIRIVGTASGIVTPAADAPMDSQITYLRDQVMTLHSMIVVQRREISTEINEVDQAVREARQDARDAVNNVEEMARDVATGTVKIQLLGLLLIGTGSIIAALPVVFGWE